MKKVNKTRERSNAKDRVEAYKELVQGDFEFSTRLTLIQQLIPSGLAAVEEILQEEVTHSAGEPYIREVSRQRWGSNPGSIYSGDQKVAIEVTQYPWSAEKSSRAWIFPSGLLKNSTPFLGIGLVRRMDFHI